MHLLHLRKRRQLVANHARADTLIGADIDEGQQAHVERLRIQPCLVAINEAARLELADTLQNRGWSHGQSPRNLGVRRSCVVLKNGQNSAVNVVNHSASPPMKRRYIALGRLSRTISHVSEL